MTPEPIDVITVVTTGAIALATISLGLLGVIFVIYAQFAQPDESGRRHPVLKPLKQAAYATLAVVLLSTFTILAAYSWLVDPSEQMYDVARVLFVSSVILIPFAGAVVVKFLK